MPEQTIEVTQADRAFAEAVYEALQDGTYPTAVIAEMAARHRARAASSEPAIEREG